MTTCRALNRATNWAHSIACGLASQHVRNHYHVPCPSVSPPHYIASPSRSLGPAGQEPAARKARPRQAANALTSGSGHRQEGVAIRGLRRWEPGRALVHDKRLPDLAPCRGATRRAAVRRQSDAAAAGASEGTRGATGASRVSGARRGGGLDPRVVELRSADGTTRRHALDLRNCG